MTLVDSNVVIDVLDADSAWCAWSREALAVALTAGPACVNDVIVSEISLGFDTAEEVTAALAALGLLRLPFSDAALFRAGRAYAAYRSAGGVRTGTLPDFFVGAQAEVLAIPLLTRDTRRYRAYFPTLGLITPDPSA